MDTINHPTPLEGEQQAERLITVCDIRFRSGCKTYYFDPGPLLVEEGAHVIIDTVRGPEFGYCVGGNHAISESRIVPPLRRVLRLATKLDERNNQENREREKRAFAICQQKIAEQGLQMQLVSAECSFDGSKILFFFTAEDRVDFRELVKNLGAFFRTRIELRQIGVRDKAKMVGGLGACGRPFCCKEFLDDFQPVSIKMAKTQSLSLNPTKISGTCGRLMCCLKYEQDAYEDLIKNSPKQDSLIDTPDGRAIVTDVNLLRQTVNVRMEDDESKVGCYKNCDICVLRNGKGKKNDPPIPKDLAPISGGKKPAARQFDPPPLQERRPLLDSIIIKSMPEDIPAVEAPSDPVKPEQPRRKNKSRKPKPNFAASEPAAAPKPAKPHRKKNPHAVPEESAQKNAEKVSKPKGTNYNRQRRRRPRNNPNANS